MVLAWWGPPEGTTRIVPVVQIVPKKIDAQETVIGYKKPATVVQEGKGDRGEEEVRASEGPSPEDLVVMEIVRGGFDWIYFATSTCLINL